jgi:sugar phosphate permease
MGPADRTLRWPIAILVSAAIAISYLDRQTLPVAIKAISRDIPLTNEQFSTLQSAFLFAYAWMYAGGGRLVDVLGTRLVLRGPVGLTIFCLAYFGQQSWSKLVMALPTDLFPQQVVGSVAGLVGFGGAMGGIVFGQLAGYLLDHGFGYGSVFAIAGTLHVTALLLILTLIPVVRPLELRQRLSYGRGQ